MHFLFDGTLKSSDFMTDGSLMQFSLRPFLYRDLRKERKIKFYTSSDDYMHLKLMMLNFTEGNKAINGANSKLV